MAPKVINCDYLYDTKWDRHTDKIFCDTLSYQARMGNFTRGDTNFSAMFCAKEAIRKCIGKEWTPAVLLDRLDELEPRYQTFWWMLSIPGFTSIQ